MIIDGYYNTYHFERSGTQSVDLDGDPPARSDVTIPERKQRNYGIHAGVSLDF
jgi:hypothetical protein